MLKLVETVRTSYSIDQLIRAFIKSWYKQYNILPKKEQIATLYAQISLETAGGLYCWNNNIANVKAVDIPMETIEYCMLHNVWEMVNGKKVIFQPPHPATWFRSFPTLESGVTFHFNFLKNTRYKIAWQAVEAGNPVLFAQLLKQQGYYTASVESYANAMTYHFNKFMSMNIFEKAVITVKQELGQIVFPTDYIPLIFNTKEDIHVNNDDSENKSKSILTRLTEFINSKLLRR